MCTPLELRVQETTKNGTTTTVKNSESRTRSDRSESDLDLLLLPLPVQHSLLSAVSTIHLFISVLQQSRVEQFDCVLHKVAFTIFCGQKFIRDSTCGNIQSTPQHRCMYRMQFAPQFIVSRNSFPFELRSLLRRHML